MKLQTSQYLGYRPLIWAIVLMILFLIPADASAEKAMSLKLDTASVQPGSEVQVPIVIEKNTGVSSLKFLVKYDSAVLTLKNIVFSKNTGTYSSVPQPYSENQVINFVSPLSPFTKTGLFATMTFSVKSKAEKNKVSIIYVEHEEDDIFDSDFNNVPLVTVNGSIFITDSSQESVALLPSALKTISEEAFMNTLFYYVVLPETTATIGSKAFANCSQLKYIYIPEKTTKIADDAFLNVKNLTIYGKEGSYAESFANKKGYAFVKQ